MVAPLLFFPERALRNVASPFSSVMVCMSAPVSLMSPLLSHTARKSTRAGHLTKMVPITQGFSHYMVPRPLAVKAEIARGGSEKTDYRHRSQTGRVYIRGRLHTGAFATLLCRIIFCTKTPGKSS